MTYFSSGLILAQFGSFWIILVWFWLFCVSLRLILGRFGSFWVTLSQFKSSLGLFLVILVSLLVVLGLFRLLWVVFACFRLLELNLGLLWSRCALFCVVWLLLDRFRSFLEVLDCFESVQVTVLVVLGCFGLLWISLGLVLG